MPTNAIHPDGAGTRSVFEVLRRRLPLLLLCVLLVPAAALAFSLSQEKEYTASASLLFRDPAFDEQLFGTTFLAPSSDPDREAATNVKLVSLDVVATRTSRRLGGDIPASEISGAIDVSEQDQSDVVSVRATHREPAMAARIANTFAREYIAFRQQADRAKIQEAIDLLERQVGDASATPGQETRSLQRSADQLRLLGSLQTGNAELVEEARPPSSPSSPKTLRNVLLGFLLGGAVGVPLAFLFERVDRRIRRPDELETIFDRPLLGTVPESRVFGRAEGDSQGLPAVEAEAFRLLRANLRYFNVDRHIDSIVVTSAAPADGKSTIAWYLAVAAADAGDRVLLLEADLRHPTLSRRLRFRPDVGLSQLLATDIQTLQSSVTEIPVMTARSQSVVRSLDVVAAGPLPPNPTDLMESRRMRELIKQAEEMYDLVVIDTPPTSVVSDAIPLVTEVSGVIVVGRLGRSTREATHRLHDQLEHLNAPVLGVVVNGVDFKALGYGYGYGGAYPTARPDDVNGDEARTGAYTEETSQ
jgi:polysaccharide biosynthesis transport protein